MLESYVRRKFSMLFTGESEIELKDRIPSFEELNRKFRDIDELGIYLHIPFCEQICPYCPYNKEIYNPDLAKRYTIAVKKEIDFYSDIVGNRPVTSFYIGVALLQPCFIAALKTCWSISLPVLICNVKYI